MIGSTAHTISITKESSLVNTKEETNAESGEARNTLRLHIVEFKRSGNQSTKGESKGKRQGKQLESILFKLSLSLKA